jgi:hypothetical protein
LYLPHTNDSTVPLYYSVTHTLDTTVTLLLYIVTHSLKQQDTTVEEEAEGSDSTCSGASERVVQPVEQDGTTTTVSTVSVVSAVDSNMQALQEVAAQILHSTTV